MVRTVHVSRVFQVDVESQPEVVEELRRLAARGFEIFGPLDLSPCGAAAKPEPEPEPVPAAAEIVGQICKRAHLSGAAVAALVGVAPETLYNWRSGSTHCPEARLQSLQSLLDRCLSLPEASRQLRDEATGAQRAMRLAASRGRGRKCPRISVDQRQEIESLRKQGRSARDIAKAVNVSEASVYRLTGA